MSLSRYCLSQWGRGKGVRRVKIFLYPAPRILPRAALNNRIIHTTYIPESIARSVSSSSIHFSHSWWTCRKFRWEGKQRELGIYFITKRSKIALSANHWTSKFYVCQSPFRVILANKLSRINQGYLSLRLSFMYCSKIRPFLSRVMYKVIKLYYSSLWNERNVRNDKTRAKRLHTKKK